MALLRSATPWLLLSCALLAAQACDDDDGDSAANGRAGAGARSGYAGAGAPGFARIQPGGYVFRPGSVPLFPGAGTSNAGDPLPNGMVCDAVPGADLKLPDPIEACYYDVNDPTRLAATLEQVLECVEEGNTVHVRLTFHPWFVDNTYGENALGWDAREAPMMMMPMAMPAPMMMDKPKPMGMPKPGKGGHTFKDLVGSDHAEITVKDGAGKVVLQFKLDYISEDPSRPSGYGSLGVTGGEGKMLVGSADAIVRWMTSLDLDLNERGFASYTTDSPATDEFYTPNPATPEWDYRVVYEAWIDASVFGGAGFGGASIAFVHASPSKAESNTITVEPGDCPCEENGPDEFCDDTPPPDGGTPPPDGGTTDPCQDNDPDTLCGDSGVPPPPDSPFCIENPEDPTCSPI